MKMLRQFWNESRWKFRARPTNYIIFGECDAVLCMFFFFFSSVFLVTFQKSLIG